MKKSTIILISVLLLLILFSSEIQGAITGEFWWLFRRKKEAEPKVTPKTVPPIEPNIIKINKNFKKDSEYPLTYKDKISHLSLNGDIKLKKDNSYVRVILKDQNNKEYLVLESHILLNDKTYSFTEKCEETCDIEATNIKSLIIELSGASIRIDSINLEKETIETGAKARRSKQKEKIDNLNKKIKERGMNWVAGETWVSRLSYKEKKGLFTKPDGTPVDRLPNLYGFEYYKGGIFELPPKSRNSITGEIIKTITSKIINKITSKIVIETIPSSWDWRNVNGENWLTSVKNQGAAGNCWAFALIGTMEAQINLYFNQHLDVDLSEQHIADCINELDLPMGMSSGQYLECTGENICYPGNKYCVIAEHGISDEACDPYAERELWLSHCDLTYICDDWQNRVWKVSDFHDYKFFKDFGTPNCPKQTMGLSEEELKQILIEKGPMSSGITSWNHAMVLVGYEIDLSDGQTVWIFKNSWGTGSGESGYVRIKVTLEDLGWASLPIGPFTPPLDSSYWPSNLNMEINCVDNDNDGYCYWGIGNKPDSCPSFCKSEKDPDDSNVNIPYTGKLTCTETDAGKDYFVKGIVKISVYQGIQEEMTDRCLGDELTEYYCEGDGWKKEYVTCPGGCSDGACIPKTTVECIDTDGGKDYFIKGVCTDTNYPRGVWDKCVTFNSKSYVIEYYCRAGTDYSCQSKGFDCSQMGLICLDGRCITSNCETDADCPGGYKCRTDFNYRCATACKPGYVSANCKSGYSCIGGKCSTGEPTCTDSDGGEDYYTKGQIDYTNSPEGLGTGWDICSTDDILAEMVCVDPADSSKNFIHYTCPSGCSDGACIECIPKTCEQLGKECDYWDDGCGGTVNCGICSSGYICRDGKCIEECTTNDDCPGEANWCGTMTKTCFDLNNLGLLQHHLYVNEGIMFDSGKTLTLANVGSDGSIMVDVDGTISIISHQTSDIVNNVKIANVEIFYKELKAERSTIFKA